MKISKITIKQLFGIKEWQGDGKNIELVGDNGTGKTSVIDAIRYALTNSSDREFIVKNGETEGEIYIETDNGLSIDRKARTAMTDYKSVKQNGNVIPSPESFLKTIFTPLQLSPMEFISMDKKTQNATILDMIQYDWNLDTIKEWFGEIPRDVNYEQNILAVLNDIQAENGYYFMHRQDVNRDIRAKKAVIADIGSSLPIDYDGERWEKENLSDLYTEIEKIRKNNETILMPEQIADKVPDAVATGEMWVMAVPAAVRRIDYEIVDPYVPMRIDRNGTRERFLVWYGELKRVRYQDNWRNLSTRTARNQKAVEWFMENKPDISYRTFMSNMDDELLKSFHVELQEVWE